MKCLICKQGENPSAEGHGTPSTQWNDDHFQGGFG
jgi:hypothetical protein